MRRQISFLLRCVVRGNTAGIFHSQSTLRNSFCDRWSSVSYHKCHIELRTLRRCLLAEVQLHIRNLTLFQSSQNVLVLSFLSSLSRNFSSQGTEESWRLCILIVCRMTLFFKFRILSLSNK